MNVFTKGLHIMSQFLIDTTALIDSIAVIHPDIDKAQVTQLITDAVAPLQAQAAADKAQLEGAATEISELQTVITLALKKFQAGDTDAASTTLAGAALPAADTVPGANDTVPAAAVEGGAATDTPTS